MNKEEKAPITLKAYVKKSLFTSYGVLLFLGILISLSVVFFIQQAENKEILKRIDSNIHGQMDDIVGAYALSQPDSLFSQLEYIISREHISCWEYKPSNLKFKDLAKNFNKSPCYKFDYQIELKSGGYNAGVLKLGSRQSWLTITNMTFVFFLLAFIILSFYIANWKYENVINRKLLSPLTSLSMGKTVNSPILELQQIGNALRKTINLQLEYQRLQIVKETSEQVAHDIRSPLSALEIVMEDFKNLPEDSRELTLNAIYRIQEIANNLTKENTNKDKLQNDCLISKTLKAVINEKKLEYQNYKNLQINFNDETDQMQFITIHAQELSRTISNLINNSIHSLNQSGLVSIELKVINRQILLLLRDSGNGFPNSILDNPIVRGKTLGKKDGKGLGLYHANKTIEEANGNLKLFNKEGANILITLPIVKPPKWFKKSINLTNISELAVLDDDQSIHDLWKKVFNEAKIKTKWYHAKTQTEIDQILKSKSEGRLYLIDYDLRLNKTGIDLIKDHKLKAILVTSSYEKQEIQNFCLENDIQLLPKYLINSIEFT